MKTLIRLAAVFLTLATAGSALAQATGQYTGAEVLPAGSHLFGGYLDASNDVVGLIAQLRLSFYPGVDFGFQGGPARISDGGSTRGTVRLGTDFKVAAHRARADAPLDVAMGGMLAVETGDNFSVLSLGPTVVVSRGFHSDRPGGVTPYASASLLYSNIDAPSQNGSDVSCPLRFGAEIIATPLAKIVVEVEFRLADDFRDPTNFIVGVNLPF
ncbi:MAG: hypothetical protein HYR73_03695 [Candidatus Eisenbacteria bacterium]|nr:hypothetical protein [Candidatus Eisenbacteria bacterium]